jgi:type I restriction enzyme M protein
MIPACLWFLAKDKSNGKFRNRENEILFIDARKLGVMISRRNRELTEDNIALISSTYHNWRNVNGNYEDIAGFCKTASIEDVIKNNYLLMPGRYVGTEEEEIDTIPFDEKMQNLTEKLSAQFARDNELENSIRENLKSIGYEF